MPGSRCECRDLSARTDFRGDGRGTSEVTLPRVMFSTVLHSPIFGTAGFDTWCVLHPSDLDHVSQIQRSRASWICLMSVGKEKRLKIKIFPFLLHFYAGLPTHSSGTFDFTLTLSHAAQTNTPNNIKPQSALPASSCLTSLNTCTFPKHRSCADLHTFVRTAQQR